MVASRKRISLAGAESKLGAFIQYTMNMVAINENCNNNNNNNNNNNIKGRGEKRGEHRI